MKPHPRIRKTIKWGGAAVTVLLVVVWIGSGWWCFGYMSEPHKGQRFGIDLIAGAIKFESSNTITLTGRDSGWISGRCGSWARWTPTWFRDELDGWWLAIPCWIPAIVTSLPTALAWRLDTLARRRARLNLCPKCNYDRAGLAAGAVCPECGSKGGPA